MKMGLEKGFLALWILNTHVFHLLDFCTRPACISVWPRWKHIHHFGMFFLIEHYVVIWMRLPECGLHNSPLLLKQLFSQSFPPTVSRNPHGTPETLTQCLGVSGWWCAPPRGSVVQASSFNPAINRWGLGQSPLTCSPVSLLCRLSQSCSYEAESEIGCYLILDSSLTLSQQI